MQKKTYFETLTEPSAFLDDWEGWLGNQTGHIYAGMFMAFWLCVASLVLMGELPHRVDVFAFCFIAYVAFEIKFQGWKGYDTIEDTVFVVGYGAGGPLSALNEIAAGGADASINIIGLIVFFVISPIHLAFGVAFRYNRDDNSKG
jgi:hypothetical protein